MSKTLRALLLCALAALLLCACAPSAPAPVEIEKPLVPTQTPLPMPTPAPTFVPTPTPTLGALTQKEIRAAEEMVYLAGPFAPSRTSKEDMLASLGFYAALSYPPEAAQGISLAYDYARDPNFLWQEEDFGPLCLRADTAADFVRELFGMELPYAQADYFSAAHEDWTCKDGVYRLIPQDAAWRVRQDSYTIDKDRSEYVMRLKKWYPGMENGKGEEWIEARFVRADNRWGLALLGAEYDENASLAALFAEQQAFYPSQAEEVPAPANTPKGTATQNEKTPKPEATPKIEKTPEPEKTPAAVETQSAAQGAVQSDVLKGKRIGIDPGHQAKANRNKEPQGPNSDVMKNKVSSGTSGVNTGIREYQVNLDVALLLQKKLLAAGAEVYMTRTTHDVDISNKARAEFFNDNKVDLGLRLHCNGSEDESAHGAFMLVPKDKSYPYYIECVKAAKCILESYAAATGLSTAKGITYRADQTGFNWCSRPVTNIEMGHLTNAQDEKLLSDPAFQERMAQGIYEGIVRYFAS